MSSATTLKSSESTGRAREHGVDAHPRKRRRFGHWLGSSVMVLGAIVMLAPFWWALAMALSNAHDAFGLPPHWLPQNATVANFVDVLSGTPFISWVINSFKVTVTATVGALCTSALAGYAFARLRFPGRDILFFAVLASLMVPQQVTVVPTFILMRYLGLVDTQASLFLPGMINAFGIFFMRQFFMGLPRELEEAARIDGAGHFRTFWSVVLPQAGPPLGALAIFVFQLWWNDFFWANIFLYSDSRFTLPLGLVRLQGLYGSTPTVVVFAAIVMICLPILALFVFTQRYLTESLARTGLGG